MKCIIALMLVCGFAYGQKIDQGVFVDGQGRIDTNNSTTNLLLANTSYTGTATDVSSYSAIALTVYSDVASTEDGLVIEFSDDASDWHVGEEYTILAGATKFFTPTVQAKYYRLIYQNNGLDQTDFDLHSMLKKYPIKWSSHNINDPIVGEDDSELVKAVVTALRPDNGLFVNIQASKSGNLLTTDAENGAAIAFGDVTGRTVIQKFGEAGDFDTGGRVTLWDGANDAGIDAMTYTYSTTADIDSVISSSASDTTALEIQGLDASSNLVVQTVTLNGQTRVALATPLYRVFRMQNDGAVDYVGDVSCYVTNAPTTGGVVDDSSLVRALARFDNNQTEMAIYTVPADTEIVLKSLYVVSAGAKKVASYEISLWARKPGKTFNLKYKASINDSVLSGWRHPYETGLYFDEGTDIELRVQVLTVGTTQADMAGGFEIITKAK